MRCAGPGPLRRACPIVSKGSGFGELTLPDDFLSLGVPGKHPGNNKQQVREAIQVVQDCRVNVLGTAEGRHSPLRSPTNCPGKVAGSRRLSAAGQDEILERWQAGVKRINRLIKACAMGFTHDGVAGHAEFSAEIEQVTVDVAVVDKAGNPITGLRAEDLEVYENGVRQAIVSFDPVLVSDAPPAKPARPSRVSTNATAATTR
mgnify:CR=1 FL=1